MGKVVSIRGGTVKVGYRMMEILNYLLLEREKVIGCGGDVDSWQGVSMDRLWAITEQGFRELRLTVKTMENNGWVLVENYFVKPTEEGENVFKTVCREYGLKLPRRGPMLWGELTKAFPYLRSKIKNKSILRMLWMDEMPFEILSEREKLELLFEVVKRVGAPGNVRGSSLYPPVALVALALWREYKNMSYISFMSYLRSNSWVLEVVNLSRIPNRDTLSKWARRITESYVESVRREAESLLQEGVNRVVRGELNFTPVEAK